MLFEHKAKRVTINVDRRMGIGPPMSVLAEKSGGASPTLRGGGNVRAVMVFVIVKLEVVYE